MLDLIGRICRKNEWVLFVWDAVDGLVRGDQSGDNVDGTHDPDALLRHLNKTPHDGIYVLLDFAPHLGGGPTRLRLLKRIAQDHGVTARTLVLIGYEISLQP